MADLAMTFFALLLAVEGTEAASNWGIVFPILLTCLIALIAWFGKGKLEDLSTTDKRIEGKLDSNFSSLIKETKSIDRRVARIEGHLGIGLIMGDSPISLTDAGRKILANSGIKEATDNFKAKLLEAIRVKNPDTAYDVQECTRRLFQEFDFGDNYIKQFKQYSFESGQWGLYDILDVGAIYFRGIVLEEFGFKIEELNQKPSSESDSA